MKAIVCRRYGAPEDLRLEDVPRPVPQDDEVRIRVHAAAVNAADWRIVRADPFLVRLMFGFFGPKYPIIGADVAGTVDAVGKAVTRFKPGDEVYADLSAGRWGAFAEYACAPERIFALKPPRLTFEESAAVPLAGITALQGLRDFGRLKPGQKVLIGGASGGVGTFAVQIARALGGQVTAVCSTAKLGLARELGAHHVIDYTQEDFTQGGRRYDLILGVNGYHPLWAYRRALTPRGTYAMVGGTAAQLFQALLLGPLLSRTAGKKLTTVSTKPNGADLDVLTQLIEAHGLVPIVERRYPLAETPAAIRYVEEGHARGKVVITVA